MRGAGAEDMTRARSVGSWVVRVCLASIDGTGTQSELRVDENCGKLWRTCFPQLPPQFKIQSPHPPAKAPPAMDAAIQAVASALSALPSTPSNRGIAAPSRPPAVNKAPRAEETANQETDRHAGFGGAARKLVF